MGKHHHHHRSSSNNNNNNFLAGLGEFLSGVNISQLASLVQALNLKNVDTSPLTSMISRLGIGNLTGNQLGAALNNNKSEGPISLNSLANLGLINKGELNGLLSRAGQNANKEKTPEEESAQQEGMNEVMGTLQSLLANVDTNQLLSILSKLNLNNENK